jgi:hypothetical protein
LRAVLPLAERFGLETALTIDVRRIGGRVVEVDVPMEHRHTGRRLAGFRHRAGQGADIVRALWPRLTSPAQRVGAILVAFALLIGVALYGGTQWAPASAPPAARPAKVVLFGVPKLGWPDIGTGRMPNLDAMAERGAVAATSVRTLSGRPSTAEGYATLGAGTRVKADGRGALALAADQPFEGGTAAAALQRRSGGPARGGDVAVLGAAATARLIHGRHLTSAPGALGDALHARGLRTAVVGAADRAPGEPERPAALAVMDDRGWVDGGQVDGLLRGDRAAPFGLTTDVDAVARATQRALASADVVVVDPGEMDRAASFTGLSSPAAARAARLAALRRTDAVLGRVAALAGPETLLLVIGVDPPGVRWHTTPMVAAGAGVIRGYLHSPSVRRLGLVTITDVAPTVLASLGAPAPDGMIGHALRYHAGAPDLGKLQRLDRDAAFRERVYFPLTLVYIVFQALVYLLAMAGFSRFGGVGRADGALRWIVLAVAAWPLATFLYRAMPGMARLGVGSVGLLLAADLLIVALASRARRNPLSALSWILGATVALICADVATGARLQTSSILGYSLHTAARFTGLGNTAFAALAASALLLGAAHVHYAPRKREALATVAGLFVLVAVVDGAPSLGDDVGGILTLVPLFGLMLWALSGRRVRARTVAVVAIAAVAAVGAAAGADVLRSPESRTHLGQLTSRVSSHGSGTFSTTVARKLSTNLHTYNSVWRWVIVIVAVYLLYLLAWARGWARLLPKGSALRVGVVATLVAGLAGNVLNDSGAVVTALVFVYMGPFITLLALREAPT